MRSGLLLVGAFVAGGFVLGAGSDTATAAPLPALSATEAGTSTIEAVDWRRRYWRRYGVWPTQPAPVVEEDVVVETDDGIVVVVPLRPLSCGEFRYWNGTACIDARYNTPYLGPK